jgi:hypothetical protein
VGDGAQSKAELGTAAAAASSSATSAVSDTKSVVSGDRSGGSSSLVTIESPLRDGSSKPPAAGSHGQAGIGRNSRSGLEEDNPLALLRDSDEDDALEGPLGGRADNVPAIPGWEPPRSQTAIPELEPEPEPEPEPELEPQLTLELESSGRPTLSAGHESQMIASTYGPPPIPSAGHAQRTSSGGMRVAGMGAPAAFQPQVDLASEVGYGDSREASMPSSHFAGPTDAQTRRSSSSSSMRVAGLGVYPRHAPSVYPQTLGTTTPNNSALGTYHSSAGVNSSHTQQLGSQGYSNGPAIATEPGEYSVHLTIIKIASRPYVADICPTLNLAVCDVRCAADILETTGQSEWF